MLGSGMKRRRQSRRTEPKPERSGPRLRVWRWLLGGVLGGAAAFGVGYLIATLVLFPQPALAGDEVTVPDLAGSTLADARELLSARNLRSGDVRALAHPTAAEGVVVAQTPLAGQRLRPGGAVRLAISGGPSSIVVPDLEGLPFESARELASRVGFSVGRRNELSDAAPGTVLRTAPSAGSQVRVPAEVILIVSEAPPPVDSGFDSLPGAPLGDQPAVPGAGAPAADGEDRPADGSPAAGAGAEAVPDDGAAAPPDASRSQEPDRRDRRRSF